MSFDELTAEQKLQVKQHYLIGLASHGIFIRTIYGNNAGTERDPSYGELNEADRLVSDDVMRSQDVDYVPGDFDSEDESPVAEIRDWVRANINLTQFTNANPGIGANAEATCYVCWALDWARKAMMEKCEEAIRG